MGSALLAGKTLCNLCCAAPASPLDADQHTALLDALAWPAEAVGAAPQARLRAPPAAWASEAEARAEWLQVAEYLCGTLLKQPPDDGPDLEALPPAPAPPVHSCSIAIGTED